MLNPALAAATAGVSAWRKLMYSLVWQSVMWRPGKLRFLIGVKNPLLSGRPRPPENTAPCGAAPVARFATSVGLPPPFVAPPATVSHPDRRALLIPSVAQHLAAAQAQEILADQRPPGIRRPVDARLKIGIDAAQRIE